MTLLSRWCFGCEKLFFVAEFNLSVECNDEGHTILMLVTLWPFLVSASLSLSVPV